MGMHMKPKKHYREAVLLKAHDAAYHTALGSLLASTGEQMRRYYTDKGTAN